MTDDHRLYGLLLLFAVIIVVVVAECTWHPLNSSSCNGHTSLVPLSLTTHVQSANDASDLHINRD